MPRQGTEVFHASPIRRSRMGNNAAESHHFAKSKRGQHLIVTALLANEILWANDFASNDNLQGCPPSESPPICIAIEPILDWRLAG